MLCLKFRLKEKVIMSLHLDGASTRLHTSTMDLKSFTDVSEFLADLAEGDTLNQNPEQCENYANDFLKYLQTVLIPKMSELSVEFRHLYRRVYGTGSYYDGLRIVSDSRNTELDINIVLSLFTPLMKDYVNDEDIELINNEAVPNGFVKILCRQKCVNGLQLKKGEKFETKCHFKRMDMDKDSANHCSSDNASEYFLHPNKTLQWFCKLVEKATRQITTRDLQGIASFSEVPKLLSRRGPAQQMLVKLNNPTKSKQFFNVDLVVAFEFDVDYYKAVYTSVDDFRNLKYDTDERPVFFAIPKIMQSKKHGEKEKGAYFSESGVNAKSDSLNWRIDFHDQERIILDAEKFPLAKPVIKILKLYKYVQALKLSSYLIKSIVMRLITKEKEKSIFMEDKKLENAVLFTLNVICSFLEQKKAPYLFDQDCNLFWKTSSDDLICMRKKVIKDIERFKCGGIEAWYNLLLKKLPWVDNLFRINRGSISGRAAAWKQHQKRNNNCQREFRERRTHLRQQLKVEHDEDEEKDDEKDQLNGNLHSLTDEEKEEEEDQLNGKLHSLNDETCMMMIERAHISKPNRVVKRRKK